MTIAKLDQYLKECHDGREVKRVLVVKMALLGLPYRMICMWVSVSKGFITKWKKRFNMYGVAAPMWPIKVEFLI